MCGMLAVLGPQMLPLMAATGAFLIAGGFLLIRLSLKAAKASKKDDQ